MNEENEQPNAERPQPADVEPEVIERRSVDAVLQGAEALGVLTGGLGTLAIGASKLKETFGGGEQGAEAPSTDAPATPAESKSGD
jgi:hypothetical protein